MIASGRTGIASSRRNHTISLPAQWTNNARNEDDPQPLGRYLDLEVVPRFLGSDPPIQLIHRDDCIEAMVLATKRGPGGAYNIAPAGNEALSTLLDSAGKLHAPLLPPYGLGVAAFAFRPAGISSLSPQLLDLLRLGRTA